MRKRNQDLLMLKALRGESVSRPPVWMMRQAGRYLPEYMEIRRKYDFFARVKTPELAAEITLQPIKRFAPDAAIIFSDILTVPQAMGMEVNLVPDKGPILPEPLKSKRDIEFLEVEAAKERLSYVQNALRLTAQYLPEEIALIGFAGAPFTLLCYMVEGKGSKTFSKAKKFCLQHPEWAELVLSKITEVTIDYLKGQIEAGADLVQIFDSWSGIWAQKEFNEYCLKYVRRIVEAISAMAPVIYYPKGSWYALENLSNMNGLSAIGLGWATSPEFARSKVPNKTLQGNLDPSKLHLPEEQLKQSVHNMIRRFGKDRYIANLGHGISPDVPVDRAKCFFDSVKSFST